MLYNFNNVFKMYNFYYSCDLFTCFTLFIYDIHVDFVAFDKHSILISSQMIITCYCIPFLYANHVYFACAIPPLHHDNCKIYN